MVRSYGKDEHDIKTTEHDLDSFDRERSENWQVGLHLLKKYFSDRKETSTFTKF